MYSNSNTFGLIIKILITPDLISKTYKLSTPIEKLNINHPTIQKRQQTNNSKRIPTQRLTIDTMSIRMPTISIKMGEVSIKMHKI
jgi:hypothetical protein